MNTLKTIFAVLAAVLLTGPASAQTKIGLIDLQKVFDGYYKTKAADALIQDQKADFLKQKKTLLEGYEKAGNDYKKALDDSNNQAVSANFTFTTLVSNPLPAPSISSVVVGNSTSSSANSRGGRQLHPRGNPSCTRGVYGTSTRPRSTACVTTAKLRGCV